MIYKPEYTTDETKQYVKIAIKDLKIGDYVETYKGRGFVIGVMAIKKRMIGTLPTPAHLIGLPLITLNHVEFGSDPKYIMCTSNNIIYNSFDVEIKKRVN